MKTCALCGITKPIAEFYTDKSAPTGYRRVCKSCVRARAATWRISNLAQAVKTHKTWEYNNRRVSAARRKRWEDKNLGWRNEWKAHNPNKLAQYASRWRKANLPKCAALAATYAADKIKATPAWANQVYIEDVYRKAAIFTKRDGIPWHVDHIVPLRSKLVCGLHCEDNLQAIHKPINLLKGNRHWPDMPEVRT